MKRILIVIQNQLLATSIKNLLAPNEGFIIRCASEDNASEIIAQMASNKPDVLILDNSHIGQEISRSLLMENNCPDVRIIIANVDDNHLKIYERFQFQISRSADFVDAIRGDISSLFRESNL